MNRFIVQYSFIIGLIVVLILAVWKAQASWMDPILNESTKWSLIAVIFAFQGLGLSKDALSQSYKPIQLPLFVLFWNFVGFPMLIASTIFWWVSPSLQTGFFFLALVPTTIALSVAYTDLSGGRVSSALFATCLSNLVGALLVPLIFISVFKVETGRLGQLGLMLEKIVFMLILPVWVGYGLRHYLPKFANLFFPIKKQAVELILLLLIFNAFADCFCQSLQLGVFWFDFFSCLAICLILFLGVSALVWKTSQWISFDRQSRIAAFFTASQKSVCSGIPLILLTISHFANSSEQAMVLLPLIAYYFFQVCFGAYLTHYFKQTS